MKDAVLRALALAAVYRAVPVLGQDGVTSLGKPINIPPSQYWDGKDGPWSSFKIQVGTPPQQIRVFPASSQTSTWLVLPEACGDQEDCKEARGRTFIRGNSSTWEEYGSYELNTFLEQRVGLDGDGLYGFDTLELGWTGDGLPSLERQLVAGILTDDFFIGSLGLNPRSNNFTDFNNPIGSLMQFLRNASTPIPSTSWSYTAGAHNLAPKVLGSLVLGGYDSTRFKPNDVSFPFGADISLDFQVAIQSIKTSNSQTALLTSGIISYIDTLVADIWLPVRTCELFEEAFGLVWNNATGLYFLNDTLHEKLLEENPTISFQVGPEVTGPSVTIELPYFNWYLTATSQYVGTRSGLYFPLRRAANDTQYVLGRAFLQSAYLSVDYDRSTFNLSQALYPSSAVAANVLPILPPLNQTRGPGGNNDQDNNNKDPSESSKGSHTGVIAGAAVGGVVAVAILAAGLFIFFRRRKAKRDAKAHELEDTDLQNMAIHEAAGDDLKYEVGEGLRHEVGGDSQLRTELSASGKNQKAAEIDGTGRPIYEMPADNPKYEMAGDGVKHEMDGEGVKHSEMEGEGYLKTEKSERPGTDATERTNYTADDQTPLSPKTSRRR